MFGLKKKAPAEVFAHTSDCRIVAADPGVQIPWNEIRRGVWEARCVCGVQHHYEPVVDDRVRLDPLDAKTSRHAGQCEFASETNAAVLRIILKVKEGTGGDYWWVECNACDNACDSAWQVPYYAVSVG